MTVDPSRNANVPTSVSMASYRRASATLADPSTEGPTTSLQAQLTLPQGVEFEFTDAFFALVSRFGGSAAIHVSHTSNPRVSP